MLILLLALCLRGGLLVMAWNHPAAVVTPDTAGYVQLSDSLGEGDFSLDGKSEIFRTPGYPLFLLAAAPLGQKHWWHGVLAAQVVLDVLLVYLTYLLGWMVLGRRAGLWAAALQAFSAVAIASSLRMLSDGMFAALATLAILLLVHHVRSGRMWSLVSAGIALGAACYVRPVGQAMLAMLTAAMLARAGWAWYSSRTPARAPVPATSRSALAGAALLAVVGLAALSPWVVRNGMKADYWGFSSFAADSVYFYALPEVLRRDPTAVPQEASIVRQTLRDQEYQQGPETPGQAVRRREAVSRRVIGDNLSLYSRLHVQGTIGFFLPGASDVLEVAGLTSGQRGTSDVLRDSGPWTAAKHYFGGNRLAAMVALPITALTLLEYAGILLLLLRSLRQKVPHLVWVGLALLIACSLLSGPFGFPRYRTMIEPVLSLLAAAGLVGWQRPADAVACARPAGPVA